MLMMLAEFGHGGQNQVQLMLMMLAEFGHVAKTKSS